MKYFCVRGLGHKALSFCPSLELARSPGRSNRAVMDLIKTEINKNEEEESKGFWMGSC